VEVSIQQQKFLLRMVKTLSRKLKKADDKIRRLNDKNAAMQELAVQSDQVQHHSSSTRRKKTMSFQSVCVPWSNSACCKRPSSISFGGNPEARSKNDESISSRKKKRPTLRQGSR
jgi:hypothetical protein